MSDEVKNESDDETTDAGEMPVVAPQNVMDRVERINVEEEMQRAYIDYSMSVIVGRAPVSYTHLFGPLFLLYVGGAGRGGRGRRRRLGTAAGKSL